MLACHCSLSDEAMLCLYTFVMLACQGCSHMPEGALPTYSMKAVFGFSDKLGACCRR